jgi:hypothetical protein
MTQEAAEQSETTQTPPKQDKLLPTAKKSLPNKLEPLTPTAKINLEWFALSGRALVSEFQNTTARMRRIGVNTTKFPPISLEYGSQVGYHKKAFSRTYAITIPKRERGGI